MALPLAGKENLVFLRVGDTSTHREWIGDPATRPYDVWLDAYTDLGATAWADDPAYVTDGRGTTKFARAQALVPELTRYEAVWFPDDDISVDPAGVERLFATFHSHGLWLAQPSLADGSYVSHEITRWNGSFEVRYTNFVEAMCPLFSREALVRCAPSFTECVSAYGIDLAWGGILGDPRDRRRKGRLEAAGRVRSGRGSRTGGRKVRTPRLVRLSRVRRDPARAGKGRAARDPGGAPLSREDGRGRLAVGTLPAPVLVAHAEERLARPVTGAGAVDARRSHASRDLGGKGVWTGRRGTGYSVGSRTPRGTR